MTNNYEKKISETMQSEISRKKCVLIESLLLDDLPLKLGIYNLLLRNLLQTFGQYDFSVIFMTLHDSADFPNIIVYFRQIFAHYLYSRGDIVIIHNLKNKYICRLSPPPLAIFALFVTSPTAQL